MQLLYDFFALVPLVVSVKYTGAIISIGQINLILHHRQCRKTKHQLYPDITFPGSHYTKGNTLPWANGGFTISELIDANLEAFRGNIFLGGKINYNDDVFIEKYEEVPYGLVQRIATRESAASTPVESYREESLKTWAIVASYASNLPCNKKYPSTTWEWTITREFFDHMVSSKRNILFNSYKHSDVYSVYTISRYLDQLIS